MVKSALVSVTFTAIAAIILQAQAAPLIRLAQTIPLEEVKGHFAHFGFDAKHGRLFATLQQQGIVQVLDAKTGKVTGAISGIGKQHAVRCFRG